MKQKIQQQLKNMTAKQLKKWGLGLYVFVFVIVSIFFLIGKLNILETAITFMILAFCVIPILKL